MKARRGRVEDRKYLEWMHTLPCLVSGKRSDSPCAGHETTAHHVRRFGEPKNDKRTLPLCYGHHLHDFGKHAIERGKRQFQAIFNIEIEAEIARLNRQYEQGSAGIVYLPDA